MPEGSRDLRSDFDRCVLKLEKKGIIGVKQIVERDHKP